MIDQIVSHYKILKKLGGGGMGVVYKARDLKLDRLVALKFLSPHLSADELTKKRFMQEAKAASLLDHPNICTIHEIDETEDGQLFIAMAYYDGETIKKKVSFEQMSVSSAIDIALQVAQGLAKAHEQGIVHRDIKPANLIMTNEGVVKILDFGLAKLAGHTRLTMTGATFGTVSYMSPEQARGDEVDHRTDIWSLGVVLYEMLTGRLPYQSEYEQAVIYAILNKTPQPVSAIVRNTPWQLDRIISHALEKNPADRLPHANAFQASLTEIKSTPHSKNQLSKKISKIIEESLLPLRWISGRWKLTKRKNALIISGFAVMLFILTFLMIGRLLEMAQGERVVSIAVMPFDNNTGDSESDWLRDGIPDMLATNLSRSKYLKLIGFNRIARVTPEFARRNGAQYIISGRVVKSSSNFRIIAQLYEMQSGGHMKSEQVEGIDLHNVINMVDQLSDRIKVNLEIEAEGTPYFAEGITKVKTNSLEAYKFYIQGRENIDKNRYDEAILNLKNATQIDSTFAHAYEELTRVYRVLGEDTLAHEAIAKAFQHSGKLTDEEQKRFLARKARLTHDYDSAAQYYRQLVLLQPDEPEWHFQLGWVYCTHKRSYDRGILEYKKAIALDSHSQPQFYYCLGYAYLERGLPKEAVSTFKKYVSLLPNEAISYDQLGKAYILTGNYALAYKELKTALRLNPDFASTLLNLGMFYASTGRGREAIKYYKKHQVQTIGKKQEELGYFFLSKLYLENLKLDEALREIKKAIDMNPNRVSSHWLLGLIQLQKGKIDSAKAICEQMENILTDVQSKYQSEFVHHLKGKIYEAAGQYDAAIEQFQQTITLGNPDLAYFRNDLALAFLNKGDLDQAIKVYKYALDFNPNYAYSYYGLGQAHEKKNNTLEAIKAYEECLQILGDANDDILLLHNAKNKVAKLKGTL